MPPKWVTHFGPMILLLAEPFCFVGALRPIQQPGHVEAVSHLTMKFLGKLHGFTFSPRTTIHWNALPAYIPVLPTLAQFSNGVCQVQTCLLLRILHIFYTFGLQITHFESQLQNYAQEMSRFFNKFWSILMFSSAMAQ